MVVDAVALQTGGRQRGSRWITASALCTMLLESMPSPCRAGGKRRGSSGKGWDAGEVVVEAALFDTSGCSTGLPPGQAGAGSAQAQRAAPQRLQLCGGAQPTAGRQQAVRGQQGSALVLLCSSMTPAPISAPLPCNPTHIRPSPAGAHLNNAHASRHPVALAVHIRPKGSLCRPQRRQHSICGVTCGNSRGGIAGTCTQTLTREIHPTLQLTARMRCSIGKGPSEDMCAPAAHSSWSKCTSAPSLPPGPADRSPGRHTSRPSSWLASLLPPAPAPHPNSTNPRKKKQSGARFHTRTNTRAHAHLSLVAAPKNRLAPAAPPPPRAPPRQAPGRVGKS